MIIRNASKTVLLTYENSTGQRPVIANDCPEPTHGVLTQPRMLSYTGHAPQGCGS
jgi:hypothetical protein